MRIEFSQLRVGTNHEMPSLPPPPERGAGGRTHGLSRRQAAAVFSGLTVALFLLAGAVLPAAEGAPANSPKSGSESIAIQNSPPPQSSSPPADEGPPRAVQLAEAVPGGGELPVFRTLGGLGLVLSFILGGFVVARRFAPQYFKGNNPDRMLRLIETLPMGDKRSIAVVQVGGRRYLVGNTSQQISILSNLGAALDDDGEAEPSSETNEAAQGRQRGNLTSFRGMYENEKSERTGPYQARPIPAELRAKMRRLRESLEG